MPGGFLHVLQLRPVLKRRGDERRPHGVGGVASPQSDRRRVLPEHPVDRVRVHSAGRVVRLGVAPERPEQRPFPVLAMPGPFQIGADTRRRLRVDRQRVPPAALAGEAERVIGPVPGP